MFLEMDGLVPLSSRNVRYSVSRASYKERSEFLSTEPGVPPTPFGGSDSTGRLKGTERRQPWFLVTRMYRRDGKTLVVRCVDRQFRPKRLRGNPPPSGDPSRQTSEEYYFLINSSRRKIYRHEENV